MSDMLLKDHQCYNKFFLLTNNGPIDEYPDIYIYILRLRGQKNEVDPDKHESDKKVTHTPGTTLENPIDCKVLL